TADDGTGIVHTAPSHGRDDYYTGLRYDLPVPNTVNERGVLTEETGEFAGTFYKACDTVVVDRLREVGALLDVRDYKHSYPHAERDEKPVIFRATEQWFVGLEANDLRRRALEAIEEVEWIPAAGQSRIEAMVGNRPDWCVSRQRPWGVGIPILYTAKGRKPVMDPAAVEAIAAMVERDGSDGWFLREPHEFLPEGYSYEGETEFTKETDVLDVWFDSGSTSQIVLRDAIYPEWQGERFPADLYLEGSDQHRGWFNSSLLIGVAATGEAPFKQVLTHGFVVDEQGRKMSKRLGNVVDPVEASEKVGADIVRYWVASVDYQGDAPCSMKILEQVGGLYRDVRNTLRFLLGNLAGYRADAELLPFDQWIVEETERLSAEVAAAYTEYRFTDAIVAVHTFCRERLSKFYLDAIKDRMYCDGLDWPSRQSGARACAEIARRLILLLAPITAHTAEEAWSKLGELTGEDLGSVHMATFLLPDEARQLEL
ncbi:isoleucine--tRNA ligase, partial [bacterium]